jgi:hypothetical protein
MLRRYRIIRNHRFLCVVAARSREHALKIAAQLFDLGKCCGAVLEDDAL